MNGDRVTLTIKVVPEVAENLQHLVDKKVFGKDIDEVANKLFIDILRQLILQGWLK